jgi:hypothetical protein
VASAAPINRRWRNPFVSQSPSPFSVSGPPRFRDRPERARPTASTLLQCRGGLKGGPY